MREWDIRRFEPGRAVTAKQLEGLRRKSIESAEAGKDIQIEEVGNRQVISLVRERILGVTFERFKIIEVKKDHLHCNLHNATHEEAEASPAQNTTLIFVAKPFQLRKTPFDGETIEYVNGQSITYTYEADAFGRAREADDGTDTEDQAMTPDYFVGEELLAMFVETGLKTNATEDPPAAGATFVEQRIFWEDLNTCGRFWAKV